MAPVVSVLMPVRNGGRYLVPALDSVLGQTGVAFELICIDDGSRDGSWQTLNRFAALDPRMQVHRAEGRGIAEALNQAASCARGRYLARMDQDDICLPGRLAVQARCLEAHPEIGVLGTQAQVIDADGMITGRQRVPVGPERVRAALETSSPFIHPTVMMRREALLRAGSYRKLFDGAEDYELWLRMAALVGLDNLPQTLLLYRRHAQQATAWRPFRQARRAAMAVVAYRLRRERGLDPLARMTRMSQWRAAFAAIDPAAVDDVRHLTASLLVDNGGTLRRLGAAYFHIACRSARAKSSLRVRRRLALACVRHELQVLRSRRPLEALRTVSMDVSRWPRDMVYGYIWHASILWRAAPPSWTLWPVGGQPPLSRAAELERATRH
ncbi:MAG TPA: glycosyltransferase [Acetobacteraceae bacterium]|nr:glycosyltransferase [Acetobacteraceae bacterium]